MSICTSSQIVSYNFCPCRILRPNTPYRLLNIDSTILSGGLFYSFSNIAQSCIGVFQSFLAASKSHQPGVFKTSRLLLCRMLIYIHREFVLDQDPDQKLEHLPNLDTMEGVLAVLSLVNIAELANVLHPDTYQAGVEPEERRFLIHVRNQGRDLLDWMNLSYALEPAPPSTHTSCEISKLAQLYLLHQADALHVSKMSMERAGLQSSIPGLTHSALYMQISGCLGLQHKKKKLPGCAKTFAWDQGTYRVSKGHKSKQRPSMGMGANLGGETHDDVEWIKAGRLLHKK